MIEVLFAFPYIQGEASKARTMSGLKQRTKDRDSAPADCRGVTAGVSLPATGLAQIAEISRRPPGQPINLLRANLGLLENAITAIAEKDRESGRSHNVSRVSPLPTARRFARMDINSNRWWIDLHPNTNEPETATEI